MYGPQASVVREPHLISVRRRAGGIGSNRHRKCRIALCKCRIAPYRCRIVVWETEARDGDPMIQNEQPRAGLREWVEGARPRTLPVNIAPVIAGTGLAAYTHQAVLWKAVLALVVAMALQVGVNYANDYSDGIRGTDEHRVGPLRLVGSGLATPRSVKTAAFGAFAVAAAAGLVVAASTSWWLVLVGAAAIAAAWFYTGGSKPYGYRGFGEVGVFVFFGLVATVGTTYVQTRALTSESIWTGVATGALACAVLVANNLRDIPSDAEIDKRTLAVVLGDSRTRLLYYVLLAVGFVAFTVTAELTSWLGLLAFVGVPLATRAAVVVGANATGPALIPVLRDTGLAELTAAIGLALGLVIAR
jgi:1,4-dihydroxy-2-naphthoate octaprenyltransferase